MSQDIQKLARKGGNATKKKYGSEHYRKLAKKSWAVRRKKERDKKKREKKAE